MAPLPNLRGLLGGSIAFLEHVNLFLDPAIKIAAHKGFWLGVLGGLDDPRSLEVHQRTNAAGGRQHSLIWANFGFQQFHLPMVEASAVGVPIPVGPGAQQEEPGGSEPACDARVVYPALPGGGERLRGCIGFSWSPDDWDGLQQRLTAFYAEHGGCAPTSTLGRYCRSGRLQSSGGWAASAASSPPALEFIGFSGNVFRAHMVERKEEVQYIGPKASLPVETTAPLNGHRVIWHAAPQTASVGGLGIRYVEFDIPFGTAAKVAKFYRQILGAANARVRPLTDHANFRFDQESRNESEAHSAPERSVAEIPIGHEANPQYLYFKELAPGAEMEAYDGYHIAVYVSDFADLFTNALSRGLVYENPRFPQFRYRCMDDALQFNEFRVKDFVDIDDPAAGVFYELEHEVRSLAHPAFKANMSDVFLA